MRPIRYPINVVILGADGKGDNVGCSGPTQLEFWLTEGRICEETPVYVHSAGEWMHAGRYLEWSGRRSETDCLAQMDATLTNLVSVAQEMAQVSVSLYDDGQRDECGDRQVDGERGGVAGSDDDDTDTVDDSLIFAGAN